MCIRDRGASTGATGAASVLAGVACGAGWALKGGATVPPDQGSAAGAVHGSGPTPGDAWTVGDDWTCAGGDAGGGAGAGAGDACVP